MTQSQAQTAAAPWMALALIVAAFVAGAGTLWSGWLGDDIALVRDNPAATSLTRALATSDYAAPSEPGAYRPVTLASFAITAPLADADVRGRDPFVDHLLNVLLHVLATWLVFCVVRGFVPAGPILAFATALVFAVHPIHMRVLAPVSGRADLLALVFACTTALAWLGFLRGNMALLPLAALSWLLALGSHEVALGVPVLLALAPASAGRRLALGAFIPVLLLYLIGGGTPSGDGPMGLGDRILAASAAFGRTVMQWIAPIRLPTERVEPLLAPDGAMRTLSFLVLVSLVAVGLHALLRGFATASRAWLSALLLLFLPVLFHAAGAPTGLSMAYVVTVPLAFLTGRLAQGLARSSAPPLTLGALAIVAVGALAYLSIAESDHWRDDETRFGRRMALHTDDVAGQQAFARFLRREAHVEQQRAIRLKAGDPERARALARRKRLLDRATEWALRATQGKGRRNPDSLRERGLVLAERQRWADALVYLREATKLDPRLAGSAKELETHAAAGSTEDIAEMFFAIGRAYEALGQRDEAAEPLRAASLYAPKNLRYLEAAGRALTRTGRYREGLPMLRRAFEETEDRAARELLASIIESEENAATKLTGRYMKVGRDAQQAGKWPQAVRAYERALQVNDDIVEAHMQTGFLRGWHYGNYPLGYEHLDRAERILREQDPEDPRLREVAKLRESLKKFEREDDERLEREAKERGEGQDK